MKSVIKNRVLLDQAREELDNPPRRYNTRASSKHNRDESPKRYSTRSSKKEQNKTLDPEPTENPTIEKRSVLAERKAKLFDLVKKGDVEGVRVFLEPMNESTRYLTVIGKDGKGNRPLYYATAFETASANHEALNIEMIILLGDVLISRDTKWTLRYGVVAEYDRTSDVINISGLANVPAEGDAQNMVSISYKINRQGEIQDYMKTPRPDAKVPHKHHVSDEIVDLFPNVQDSSYKTTEQYLREIGEYKQSRDQLFKFVRKGNINGVEKLLSPTIDAYDRHSMVVSSNESYYTSLYYVSGWRDAKPDGNVANVDMLRLLMQHVIHFPVTLYSGYGPRISANRKEGGLINVYGIQLLMQDGSIYIHDPYSKVAVDGVKAFEISYDIDAKGKIVNYLSTEKPDTALIYNHSR
jgi:hypothetical protein